MRSVSFTALIVGVLLIPSALGVAKLEQDRKVAEQQRAMAAAADQQGSALESYAARARAIILLTANAPAFASVLAEPGTREQKVARQSRNILEVTHHLGYLEKLYPTSIGEACFIDADGEELARVVAGEIAPAGDLSTEEEQAPFFAPAFALRPGQVHQTKPYVSPDTEEWVVANATLIPQPSSAHQAIAHFEVTVESFRRAMGKSPDAQVRVIDSQTGRVIIDGDTVQRIGARLGAPGDRDFAGATGSWGRRGITEVGDRQAAYRRVRPTVGNANDWIVVATAKAPTGGLVTGVGAVPIIMLSFALAIILLAGLSVRSSRRELEAQAATDALTGLGNRRTLLADLDRAVRTARADGPVVMTLFDLNGFKHYNDTFGHPAGDALLQRLGSALGAAVQPFGGRAYRPGGDEFCVIARTTRRHAMEQAACDALAEVGDGFTVSTAYGSVAIPQDTGDATEAMRKADEAMYAQKQSDRAGPGRQSSDVLLRALAERHPDLGVHQDGVAELAAAVGKRVGIEGEDLVQLRRAAALHDIGKVAIPDAIINKAGSLTDEEWVFMRGHTLVGERIIAAAPALGGAARIVRSSHEAWNGAGYPDALADVEIPLGARIIAVCDAFDAMISERPYAKARSIDDAVAELIRCAGTQFDPTIVEEFRAVLADRAEPPVAGALVADA